MTTVLSIDPTTCQTRKPLAAQREYAVRPAPRGIARTDKMAVDPSDKKALNIAMRQKLFAVATSRDVAAFEELFRYYGPRVRAYMAKLSRDGQLAEELMQETMVAVWNKAAQYSPDKGNVSTWIFTIARNQRIDHWRKANRPDFDPNDPAFVPAEIKPADAAFDMNEDADRLHRAMETLPPEQLELLRLSFFEEASHGTISEKLGLPLGTVKSRIRLAFAKLRTALEDRS